MVISAYVLKKNQDWWSRNCYDAYRGFTDRGILVEGFEFEQIKDLPLTKETIVFGTIGATRNALLQIGVVPPAEISIPNSIKEYAKRKVWYSTVGEVKKLDFEQNPVFIKPKDVQKLFTGFVLNNFRNFEKINGFPDNLELLVSEVVKFKSEWRFYILDKEIIGVGHYNGDPRWFPNPTVAEYIIEDWKEQPIAYSIDLGTTGEDRYSVETMLVEVNDAYALGNYGLPSTLYAKMIEARWNQLVSEKQSKIIDTIESLAIELGTKLDRKEKENIDAIFNIECWLKDAISADNVIIELNHKPVVKIVRKQTESCWTWPETWPHQRLISLIGNLRQVSQLSVVKFIGTN